MNQSERQAFAYLYQSRVKIFERKYRAAINALLRKQVSKIVSVLENHGVNIAKHEIRKLILDADLSHLLLSLYKDIGLYFAKFTYTSIRRELRKTGSLGESQQWVQAIQEYFSTHLLNNAVIPINQTTRDLIMSVLDAGEAAGLSIEEMARQLTSEDFTIQRARLIARTESAKAANVGRQVAVRDIDFEMNKEWITAHDSRVRADHADMGGQIIDENELFDVGGEQMQGPGDPSASPENICNCRCTMAYVPKRNAAGRLIPKS